MQSPKDHEPHYGSQADQDRRFRSAPTALYHAAMGNRSYVRNPVNPRGHVEWEMLSFSWLSGELCRRAVLCRC
ncbi:hypothetical protein BJ508DRAFT_135662 [Ascobolus immersus RN42]|uniref:Uncharacterized protein n=1 Tax=Ascobolus immersus RN42 TaxID=1160509 RepID=A0A3N4IPB1_ASCIM|nr:hypothetical protein BJ508DRAFT_135662 [Ascobolus immersus RN42]